MRTDTAFTSLRFSTRALAPSGRLPALRELFDRSVQLKIEAAPDHAVEMEMLQAPGMRRTKMVSALTARMTRPAPMLADREDTICLMIKTAGRMQLDQAGRESAPEHGDGVLLVYRQPAALHFEDATYLSVRVPFDAVAPIVGVEDRAGRRIARDDAALSLLLAYVTALPKQLADPQLGRLAAMHVHDLFALAIGAAGEGREIARQRSVRVARLAAIKADIAQNAVLTLNQLAARQGVSPRYVQMLFEQDGATFSAFSAQTRLDEARRMLTSPRFAAWSITQIAFESGFGDVSHFNRRFRRRCQMTPSDMRRLAG